MTDINIAPKTSTQPAAASGQPTWDIIELLFFAYRDFVGDPDEVLSKFGLGRVLKQLVDQGYVLQREGAQDRRQRLLYVTPKGEALALKLAMLQTERISRAFGELGQGAHDAARRFLAAMIDAENRDGVIER